jgi:hypothetical protein
VVAPVVPLIIPLLLLRLVVRLRDCAILRSWCTLAYWLPFQRLSFVTKKVLQTDARRSMQQLPQEVICTVSQFLSLKDCVGNRRINRTWYEGSTRSCVIRIQNFVEDYCDLPLTTNYYHENDTEDFCYSDPERRDIHREQFIGEFSLEIKLHAKATKQGFERIRHLDDSLVFGYARDLNVNTTGMLYDPKIPETVHVVRGFTCEDELCEVIHTLDAIKRNVLSRYMRDGPNSDQDDRDDYLYFTANVDYQIYFHLPGGKIVELLLSGTRNVNRYTNYGE